MILKMVITIFMITMMMLIIIMIGMITMMINNDDNNSNANDDQTKATFQTMHFREPIRTLPAYNASVMFP